MPSPCAFALCWHKTLVSTLGRKELGSGCLHCSSVEIAWCGMLPWCRGPTIWDSCLCDGAVRPAWEMTEHPAHTVELYREQAHSVARVWCDSVNMQEIWSCGYGWRAAWIQYEPKSPRELDHPPCSCLSHVQPEAPMTTKMWEGRGNTLWKKTAMSGDMRGKCWHSTILLLYLVLVLSAGLISLGTVPH